MSSDVGNIPRASTHGEVFVPYLRFVTEWTPGRRLAAARVLAGMDTREQLARAINIPGLGAANLGNIERGERTLRDHEIPPIAEALGIDPAFFRIDFANLTPAEPENLAPMLTEIAERLAGLEVSLSSRLRGVGAPTIPGDTGRRLEAHKPSGQDRPRQGSEPANGVR